MKYATDHFSISNSITLRLKYSLGTLFVLITLILAKDMMHAYLKNYSFYASESLLFGSFWVLFIPFILFYPKTISRKYQIVLAVAVSFLHVLFFSGLVTLVSLVFMDDNFIFQRVFIDTTARYGLVCLGAYISWGLYFRKKEKSPVKIQQRKVSQKISVAHGVSVKLIDVDQIIYVSAEKPYIAIMTNEGRYLQSKSLKGFLEQTDVVDFIRIHKSVIINANKIISHTSRKNGDYDIELNEGHMVRASRSYREHFMPILKQLR